MVTSTNQPMVSIGSATRSDRVSTDRELDSGGTLWSLMLFPSSFSLILSSTAGSMGVRAALAIALACVALVVIDRMKPATPSRPIHVRVDHKPVPLHREPDRRQRTRTAGTLSVGAVFAGTIVACIVGFILTVALELVGGLLRS